MEENAIDTLPPTWLLDKDIIDHPMEAKHYADAVQRLTTLSAQRREIRQRVERLRRLKATVEPLQTEDGGLGIQENLVTRGGDVEKELEKMRVLLVRVAARVGSLPTTEGLRGGEEDVKPLSELRKRNVDEFLADSKVFPAK